MKPLKKIAGFNLLAILIYSAIFRLTYPRDSMSVMLVSAVAVGLHVLVCLLVAMVSYQNRPLGRAWLLGAGIVLLVGFSVCLGNASI